MYDCSGDLHKDFTRAAYGSCRVLGVNGLTTGSGAVTDPASPRGSWHVDWAAAYTIPHAHRNNRRAATEAIGGTTAAAESAATTQMLAHLS